MLIGRTDAEAEAPILWPPDGKSQLVGKNPDAGKDRGTEKGVTEDEMVGWNHQLNGHEFEQTQGDSEGQGSLVCCSPWGCKESDMTAAMLNNNKLSYCPLTPISSQRGNEASPSASARRTTPLLLPAHHPAWSATCPCGWPWAG